MMSRRPGTALPGSPQDALRRARRGDPEAFGVLIQQYQSLVYGLALRLSDGTVDCMALAEEAFVRLHSAIARIANADHLDHWLIREVSREVSGHNPAQAPDAAEVARILREDFVPQDPGAAFTERVQAHIELRWSHRQRSMASPAAASRRNRWALLAGLLAAGFALGLMVLWLSDAWQTDLPAATSAPNAASPASNPAEPIAMVRRPGSSDPSSPIDSRPALRDVYTPYSMILLPPRHDSQDADARAAAETLHAALITELRRIPDLQLLIPGVTAPPSDLQHPADYLLTITSLDTIAQSSGELAFRVVYGRGASTTSPPAALLSAGSSSPQRQWPVQLKVQPIGQPATAGFTATLQVGTTAATLAARQAELLRLRFFPDASVKQRLVARIHDAALPAVERNRAMYDLLGTTLHGRGPELELTDVSAIMGRAAAMSDDQRAHFWRSLRGAPQRDLIDPLLDSLRREPDENVRFEALATLAADYGSDARVRAAMEAASREDPDQTVRTRAQRALSGNAEWRAYVSHALNDTTLSYPQRLAPLLLTGRSASTPDEAASLRTQMEDPQTRNQLVSMIRDSWFDPTQTRNIREALALLADAEPPGLDLLIEFPQDNLPAAATQPTTAANPAPVAAPASPSAPPRPPRPPQFPRRPTQR